MPDAKLTNLTANNNPDPDALVYVVTTPGTTPGSRKSTLPGLRRAVNQGTTPLADGATINTDAAAGNVFTVTLGGNRTLANPTNLAAGASYAWIVRQDATGSRTLAFGTAFKFPDGDAPTLTTAANAVDMITGISDGASVFVNAALNFS